MEYFDLRLQSATQDETIHHVERFVGEDASGQFGILAHHTPMMTCLKWGLAWFRDENHEIEYLALPGGIVYFTDNELSITTRHYVRHKDYQILQHAIKKELRIEEEQLRSMKDSLHRLDENLLKRLWELKRQTSYGI
jgi:F-type H+-transporting ATPase subunit epsilon